MPFADPIISLRFLTFAKNISVSKQAYKDFGNRVLVLFKRSSQIRTTWT